MCLGGMVLAGSLVTGGYLRCLEFPVGLGLGGAELGCDYGRVPLTGVGVSETVIALYKFARIHAGC